MSTRTTSRLLLAALAAGSLLLAGCQPATGQQGGTSLSGGCDPHGFGPFSGCGGEGTTEQAAEPVAQSGTCDPHGFGPLSGCDSAPVQDSGRVDEDTQGTALMEVDDAEHEAGHVLLARVYGWEVQSSNIYPGTDKDPETVVLVPANATLRQQVTQGVAGVVADELGSSDDDLAEFGGIGDFGQIAELLEADHVPPDQRDQIIDSCRADATQVIRSHTAQFNGIKADLLDNGRLG